jgi:hypothetical protein
MQDRVVGLANPGDIVAISADCPQAFVEYLQRITGITDMLTLRYKVSRDLRERINATSVFSSLIQDPRWEEARRRNPTLDPYMQSPAIYEAARAAGLAIPQETWKAAVTDRLTEKMNDKAILYQECENLGIPVPGYWVTDSGRVANHVISLLREGHSPLYVRQTRSGGAFGNITVEQAYSKYIIHELGNRTLSHNEFIQALEHFIKTGFGEEFLITELLDLYASPGTLFFADDAGITVLSHTYQILQQNRRFLGFMYPVEDDMISNHFKVIERSIHLLIEPWRQLGYRGYGNIDWMVTKDGASFIAERNARQTAVIPPLKIANELSQPGMSSQSVIPPALSIFTMDRVYFDRLVTFEDVHAELREKRLLWEQSKSGEGVVITVPPLPGFGINSAGIMAVGSNLPAAHDIYRRTLHALGSGEDALLFTPKL